MSSGFGVSASNALLSACSAAALPSRLCSCVVGCKGNASMMKADKGGDLTAFAGVQPSFGTQYFSLPLSSVGRGGLDSMCARNKHMTIRCSKVAPAMLSNMLCCVTNLANLYVIACATAGRKAI